MPRPRVHPLVLIGVLSVAAAIVSGWPVGPHLPAGYLVGFLDGLAVATLCGHLLAVRAGRWGPS
jgi:hypothetical protein